MREFMKLSLMAFLFCWALAMTSCTKEEMPKGEITSAEEITVTAYVDNHETKVTSEFNSTEKKYTFEWEENDTFSVVRNEDNKTFTKAEGENQFTGTDVDPDGSGTYYAIHPVTAATDHTAATFDISDQTEDAAYVLYSSTDNISTFKFKHAMAYLRLSLPEEFHGATCDITIFTPTDVFTDGTINLEDGKLDYTNSSKNYIKLTRQIDKDNPLLVAIPPMGAEKKTLSFSIKKGDAYYEATLSGDASKDIVAGRYYSATLSLTEAIPYITFISNGTQGVKYSGTDLQWSTNRTTWSSEWSNFVEFGNGTKVYVRAKDDENETTVDNSDGTGTESMFSFQAANVPVACVGDIRTLIDGAKYKTVETGAAKFKSLFKNCKVITTAPDLPATTLAAYCYSNMFNGCTNLKVAPDLPATTLAASCYSNMFYGCTNLKVAPELPAETLADNCYEHMFNGCKSLITAPNLPAMSLSKYCYYAMFQNCINLTAAPALPATTLAEACYGFMFFGCTGLTTAPELQVTALEKTCYQSMFRSTGLTTAPQLPATTMAQFCYSAMFMDCKNLTAAPDLPAMTLANYCYQGMFQGCTSLTTAPDLPATELVTSCYKQMFTGCTKLSYIKAMFTTEPSNDYTQDWVYRVAATGTFVKNAEATWDVSGSGYYGIPAGWTVQTQTPSASYVVNGVNYGEGIPLPGLNSTTIIWAPVNCGYDADHKYGLLYQAGRKDGQDYSIGSDKKTELASGASPEPDKFYTNWSANEWSNDPCPNGWRVPTFDELNSLMTVKESGNHDGMDGYWAYGTVNTGKKVFLPAGGFISDIDYSAAGKNNVGYYWSSTSYPEGLFAFSYITGVDLANSCSGMSVRCVKE